MLVNGGARRRPVSGTVIETQVDAKSGDFAQNSRRMVDRLTEIKNEEERIRQGGGAKAIESQHKKGRLTARERIAKLIDPRSPFFGWGFMRPHEMIERGAGLP